MKINWIKKYNSYVEFLGSESLLPKTQREAKKYLKEEVLSIIAMNGEGELYESERKLCTQLNIKLESL